MAPSADPGLVGTERLMMIVVGAVSALDRSKARFRYIGGVLRLGRRGRQVEDGRKMQLNQNARLSVAPMMDWTDTYKNLCFQLNTGQVADL